MQIPRYALWLAGVSVLIAGWMALPRPYPATAQESALVTLRIAMPEPDNLDPAQLSRFDPNARDLVENLFVGLTRFNPLTQQVDPMLAESWTVSDDGLTWTFNLRDDVQWVRFDPATQQTVMARPVAAGDVVYAIQRGCDPLRPSPVTTNLMIVRGCLTVANAFPEIINDLFIAREIGVRATGPYTLEIDLQYPAAYFPALLSAPEFRPLAREAVTENENWTKAPTVITNGPYLVRTWNATGIALMRNPFWPDPFDSNIERVDIAFTNETSTGAALITSQRTDMARLTPEEAAVVRATYPDLLRTSEGTSLVMLGFSYDRALVQMPEVRRALSFAIDRDALVQQFFPGQAQALTQFTPPGVVAAPALNQTLYDPARAQSYLATAGFANCAGLPESLILLVPDDEPVWTEVGNFITQQWATTLGCNPSLFEVKAVSRTLLIELAHANYDPEKVTRSHMWLVTWNADYLDANAWLYDALHCHYGFIRSGRPCEPGDNLLDQAALESDPGARATLYTETEETFFGANGTFPVAPLYMTTSAWLQQPWLTGVNAYGPARFDLWIIDTAGQSS